MKQIYQMKLQVMSPVYIGSGDTYSRCDYVYIPEKGKVYLLNKKKWIEFLVDRKLYNSFIDGIELNGVHINIYKWLNDNNRIIREKDLPAFILNLSEAVYDVKHMREFRNHEIKGFIKNANREPYIPGSTIKGAITNAILAQYLDKNKMSKKTYSDRINKMLTEYDITNSAKKLNQEILKEVFDYKIDDIDAIFKGMSGISVSDSEPLNNENLTLFKKEDVIVINGQAKSISNKKSGRPVFRECLDVDAETTFSLTIDVHKLKKDLGIVNIDSLMAALKYRNVSIYGREGVITSWKDSLAYLPKNSTDDGVMQLGGGVGFHSKTIIRALSQNSTDANRLTGKMLDKLYKNKKHIDDRPISPRALKVTTVRNKMLFMGFCKIKEIKK